MLLGYETKGVAPFCYSQVWMEDAVPSFCSQLPLTCCWGGCTCTLDRVKIQTLSCAQLISARLTGCCFRPAVPPVRGDTLPLGSGLSADGPVGTPCLHPVGKGRAGTGHLVILGWALNSHLCPTGIWREGALLLFSGCEGLGSRPTF